MNNISVLELMVKHYEERGGGHSQKEALNEAISLAKDYEQAKAGLPKGISLIDLQCSSSACGGCIDGCKNKYENEYVNLHQVALSRVKFKKRLPEIIRLFLCGHYACSDGDDKQYPECEIFKDERRRVLKCPQRNVSSKISQAILSEMGGE